MICDPEEAHQRIVQLEALVFELEREIAGHADIIRYHEDYALEQNRARVRAEQETQNVLRQAQCYEALQAALLKNPTLMEEWARLCFVMKLDDPEVEKFQPSDGTCYSWDTKHPAWEYIYGDKRRSIGK